MSRSIQARKDEALHALDGADQNIRWLGAILRSIGADIENGDPDNAIELAELGAHLSLEWSSELQSRTSMFRKALDKGAAQ
ncbi:hypothetical protein QN382_12505 [Pseudomonas sp. 10B1]|uniref:hypothetical protein n=1 Tax=unclassified Pseudomonas TaxID=196821 RepID=UPI002B228040|nr:MULTISPECIES: hypothetical protein [unclassified Pseudomonas]MEA9996306.1 hypothetical protein [Pseudomonas sp. AA4]MEB0086652.1 hypothetical protein [Pseudomonas sp. RTI1]MEB0124702.1 hypothetical protein [Pseudomonas sp. CCC1.2]MEB0154966.1 hypothetical protein [Pseudomonas sp. CCC4.3]MEB0217925.1 hypothetical protein [Pseudomonas sp. AB12(2023)]